MTTVFSSEAMQFGHRSLPSPFRASVGLNRYYVPNLPRTGEVQLTPDEAHHAVRVRREEVGAPCILFDGHGNEAAATFARTDKREAVLQIDSFRFDPKVSSGIVTLGVAMPKGDRQKDVIEKAVELGVHRLVPILTQRSVSISDESHLEKWRRYVIESCKQCERNQLMEIETLKRFCDLINKSTAAPKQESLPPAPFSPPRPASGRGGRGVRGNETEIRFIAHPSSSAFASDSMSTTNHNRDVASQPSDSHFAPLSTPESIFIVIGPEGGFTDQEVQMAFEHDWKLLDLGPRILRVETAVSMASVLAGLMIQGRRSESRRLPETNDYA